jgi:hypothetical protein
MQSAKPEEEAAMNEIESAQTLESIERLRDRTHRVAHPSWLPFLIFGALVIGAVPFSLAGDDGWDGYYWLAAGPIGGIATWKLIERRGAVIGLIDRNVRVHAAIIAAMVAGGLIIGWAGGESAFSEAGTVYPIAAGLLAIAAINRSTLIAIAGAGIAAWGTGVLIADPTEVAAWTYAGEGAILFAAGLITLSQARPSAPEAGMRTGARVSG